MKKFFVFVFCCFFFFGVNAEEKYNIIVEDGVCGPDDESVEVEIVDNGQKIVKTIKCPSVPESVPEIPTVIKLIGERTDKNYFFGSISYRFAHEEKLDLHIPTFSGGFLSFPFIKGRAGVKASVGYGIPSNYDGFRNMLQWQLMVYVRSYQKDLLNINLGYQGSLSWGEESLSRNESAGLIEMEYFIIKNLSVSFGVFIGGAQDSFYDPNASWKLSSGITVSTTARF
ncbi:MAG: hypothetical protein WC414_01010 [Patescibacteria group bacterium]